MANAQSSTTLALWNFEGSVPTTAGPHRAELGEYASDSFASTNTGGTIANPNGVSSSANSFSSTGWNIGEFFEFTTSTAGFA